MTMNEEKRKQHRQKLAEQLKRGRATAKANREAKKKIVPEVIQPVAPLPVVEPQRIRRPLSDLFGSKRPAAAQPIQPKAVKAPVVKPVKQSIPFNWWYAGMFGFIALSLAGGAFYASTRSVAGIALLMVFGGVAYACYWRSTKNIPQVPTLTAAAPTMGKATCLCVYGSKDAWGIKRAVKIQFESRRDKGAVQAELDELIADKLDLTADGKVLKTWLEVEYKNAIPSGIDRWYIEDISQWLPVVFTDFRHDDCNGEWAEFELPDAKYTDPARMAIPLNMSAVQKWRELEAGLFEKLKPLIMVGANALMLFFMFLMSTNETPTG